MTPLPIQIHLLGCLRVVLPKGAMLEDLGPQMGALLALSNDRDAVRAASLWPATQGIKTDGAALAARVTHASRGRWICHFVGPAWQASTIAAADGSLTVAHANPFPATDTANPYAPRRTCSVRDGPPSVSREGRR